MKYHFILGFLFFTFFFFNACELVHDETVIVLPLEIKHNNGQNLYSDWVTVNKAQSAYFKIFELLDKNSIVQERINVLALDKNKFIFDIKENIDNPLNIKAWHSNNKQALAIINGSFFDENYRATGGLWLKGQGKIISLNGKNKYDGAILIDVNGNLFLRYLPQNSLSTLNNDEQILVNFPMLIAKRQILLKDTNGEKARRSLIAENEQFIYFISTSTMYFSLYEIMSWVKENLDNVENVLNLDGGSSTGMSIAGNLIQWSNNSLVSVPNVICAYEKK